MDELTVIEIINGLSDPNYVEYRLTLLQLLSNKFIKSGDGAAASDESELNLVCNYCLLNITKQIITINNGKRIINEIIHYLLLTLANISTTQVGSLFLSNLIINKVENKTQFTSILQKFLEYDTSIEPPLFAGESSQVEDAWITTDPLQHFASVLCNISQSEEVRRLIMLRSSEYIQKLLPHVRTICLHVLTLCMYDNFTCIYPTSCLQYRYILRILSDAAESLVQ